MKTKLFIAAFLVVGLSGCSTFCKKEDPIIQTVYVEKKVPVNAVPQPPKVERPIPETSKLTAEDRKNIGKVSQAVVTEKEQWEGYSKILELIINKYKEMADKSEVQTDLDVELPKKPQ